MHTLQEAGYLQLIVMKSVTTQTWGMLSKWTTAAALATALDRTSVNATGFCPALPLLMKESRQVDTTDQRRHIEEAYCIKNRLPFATCGCVMNGRTSPVSSHNR